MNVMEDILALLLKQQRPGHQQIALSKEEIVNALSEHSPAVIVAALVSGHPKLRVARRTRAEDATRYYCDTEL